MPDKPSTNESDVLKLVIDNLRSLQDDSRARVLKTVLTYFDFDVSPSKSNGAASTPISATNREPTFGNRSVLSPKDFMHQKEPKTDVERVTCLAYYMTNYREMPHFRTEDISKLNTEAAQIKLSNPSFSVVNAANAGLLTPAGGGKKQISVYGEKVVMALPDREKVREVLKSFKRRSGRRKGKHDDKDNHANDAE